ncbi:helix-turn-helix domain-containing protein [Enterococcus spodopteracolus]|uniref:helix-turn-helix domain-containing protein n=1 Tax=Enterococcus spodopteracolus TaxID=3034501 RepID=UPI0026499A82|nr:helix-turn-helix domain-containing protein [Enterococcus spodopteracolus]
MGVLEKQLERQISLLYLLNIEPSNIINLAKELSITDKTIAADIDSFNTACFPARIETNQYKEVSLSIPKKLNLDDIFVRILNNSTNVKILKYIFITEPSLSEIATKLFLSKTSIRRIVVKMNTYFLKEKINVQIKLENKLTITGNEIEIRRLFASMFKEIYKVKEFPYFDTIYQMLRRCLKVQKRTISTPKVIYSVYYIYSSIIRIGNKHLIPEKELIDNEQIVGTILEIIQSDTVFCTLMSQKYKFNVTQKNVSNILTSYFGLMFTEIQHRDQRLEQNIERFLQSFYSLLAIDMPINTTEIEYFFDFINFYKELAIFKVSYADIFYKKMMENNPKIWQAYQKSLQIAQLNFVEQSELLHKELLLELIISSNDLLRMIEPKIQEKSILLLSSQEVGLSLLYKNLILHKHPFLKNIDIYEKDVFSIDYQLINQYDLILTDLSLNFDRITSEILKISKVPTSIFWNNFEQCLYSS